MKIKTFADSVLKLFLFLFLTSLLAIAMYYQYKGRNVENATNYDSTIPPMIDSNPFISLGPKNASVVMIEFFDPACPYSYMYFNNTFFKIYDNYILTNKVRYIVRAFPLEMIHPHSFDAARYLYCLYAYTDFGAFALGRTILYNKRKIWMKESGFNLTRSLVNSVFVDNRTFNRIARCYENNETAFYVYNDYAIGRIYGVVGTPSLVIVATNKTLTDKEKLEIEQYLASFYKVQNYSIKQDPYGRYLIPIIGAVPYEVFKYVLDKVVT